ncbi:3-isopropylmalate dehydratase small subunit [Tropicibacter sp. R16_0]|uniref:3-isopropylmalate dehydratase small subunit n=1 Tax=Tropicibacter sp. R16_0 TaxID=2821102 RepID=UPI001ADAAC2B|nr:3-isopropylmalate dehydratase small subunit [Tropicibacter sp. R16_0]
MSGWSTHTGLAIALDQENVDTDQLIPARFMSTPRSEGYGQFLLNDLRRDEQGRSRGEHPLNRHPEATVLVSRRNFGSGSSREAAVYALVDFGIRAVLAPSFGDIFASNAVNNGLLPARLSEDVIDQIITQLGDTVEPASVDLQAQTISLFGETLNFEIDPTWRQKLVNGWDDIDLTQAHADAISDYRTRRAKQQPWIFPAGDGAG